MALVLYNTAVREKQTFTAIDDNNVRMYVCGPTVYDQAHIGNARPAIVFDTLFRLLRHIYGEDHVTYARNITDVEDKIIARASERGVTIKELTQGTTEIYHKDIGELNVLLPTVEPFATDHIPEMVEIIEKLITNGHAYEAEGHVLFDVQSMDDYGKLSGRSLKEMVAGARVEIAPYKKDAMDFVLWKPSDADTVGWEGPWGKGRPGWHIECSAMSSKHLGETFDIHGGGIDLAFPHHENEVAQSLCAHGPDTYAKYWMHNGFLQVEGQKMSKSLGNFTTIREVLNVMPGEVARLQMMSSHYRQPIDWTEQGASEARKILNRWYKLIADVGDVSGDDLSDDFLAPLMDDLNTPQAITVMHELAGKANDGDVKVARQLKAAGRIMGVLLTPAEEFLHWVPASSTDDKFDATLIEDMIVQRTDAKKNKDFASSDKIRDDLAARGIILEDTSAGTSWKYK
jgi:cysteinyl-tRNA synthetase